MAKKDKKNKLDFDDGLDDLNFDFDDFDVDPTKDDRKPITKVATSFLDGVKSDIADSRQIRKRLEETLPKEYASSFEAADEVANFSRDLYNTAAEELRPAVLELRRLTRRLTPRLKDRLPGKLGERLERFGFVDEDKTPSKEEIREAGIASGLGEIFEKQAAKDHEVRSEEAIQTLLRQKVEDKQHGTQVSVLKDISNNINELVSYQDQITAKYQRKSLELQYRQYYTTHDIYNLAVADSKENKLLLQSIVKNTSLPESEKIKMSEQAGMMLRERFIGKATDVTRNYLSQYGKNIIDRVRNTASEISDGIQMFTSGLEMTEGMGVDPYTIAGSAAGSSVSDTVFKFLSERLKPVLERNENVKKWGQKLNYNLNTSPYALKNYVSENSTSSFKKGEYFDAETGRPINDIYDVTGPVINSKGKLVITEEDYLNGRDDPEGSFGFLKRGIKDWFISSAPSTSLNYSFKSGLDESLEPANFTALARKSLTDIIPGYLSRIHHELAIMRTGDATIDRVVYNNDRGTFTTFTTSTKDVAKRLFSSSNVEGLRRENEDLFKNLDPNNTLNEIQKEALTTILLNDAIEGRFDPSFRKYLNVETYKNLGLKESDARDLIKLLKSNLGYNDEERSFNDSSSSYASRNAFFNRFKSIESYIPNAPEAIRAYGDIGNIDQLISLGLLEDTGEGYKISKDSIWSYLKGKEYAGSSREHVFSNSNSFTRSGGFNRRDFSYNLSTSNEDIKPNDETYKEDSQNVKGLEDFIEAFKEGNTELVLLAKEQLGLDVTQTETLIDILEVLKTSNFGLGEGEQGGFISRSFGKAKGLFGRGMNYLTSSYRRMGNFGLSGFNRLKNFSISTYNKTTDFLSKKKSDLKIKGTDRVVLHWNKLKAGEYFDAETGKIITSWDDVKGAIKDKYGNIILSLEEYNQGLEDNEGSLVVKAWGLLGRGASSILGVYQRPLNTAKNFAIGSFRMGRDLLEQDTDLYTADDLKTPKLLVRVLKAGGYRSKNKQKVIRYWKDIDGPIVDLEGNVQLSIEDMKKGLVDKNGRPLKSLMEKIKDVIFIPYKLAKKGVNLTSEGIKSMFNMGKTGLKGILNKLGFDATGEVIEHKLVGINKEQLDVLKEIRDILLAQNEDPSNPFDRDGDGIRDNSWKDIIARRKKEKEGQEEEKEEVEKEKDDKWWSKLTTLLMGAAGFIGSKIALLYNFLKLKLGAGLIGDMIGRFPGGRGGRGRTPRGRGGLLRRGAGALKGGATRLGGAIVASKASGWLLGKGALAATATLGSAKAVAGGVAATIGGVISAPVLLTAAGATLAVAGGWWLWKRYKSSKVGHLTRVRLAQYGVRYTDEDHSKRVLWLENQLEKNVTGSGDSAHIDIKGLNGEELIQNFGIDPKNTNHVNKFIDWFERRFKPVLVNHVNSLKMLETPNIDLIDIDDKIKSHDKFNYLNSIRLAEETGITSVLTNPFGERRELRADHDYVERIFRDALVEIDRDKTRIERQADRLSRRENIDREEAINRVYEDRGFSRTETSEETDIKTFNDTESSSRRNNLNGNVNVVGNLDHNVMRRRHIAYDELDSIRFKSYGLRTLETTKAENLIVLEEWVYENLSREGSKPKFIVDYEEAYNKFAGLFSPGLSDRHREVHKEHWVKWFEKRFLPIFLGFVEAIDVIRPRANLSDVRNLFTSKEKVDIAKALSALDAENAADRSIRMYSPWLSYSVAITVDYSNEVLSLENKGTEREIIVPLAINTQRDRNGSTYTPDENNDTPNVNENRSEDTYTGINRFSQGSAQSASQNDVRLGGNLGGAGSPVNHPGNGTGGNINDLPIPEGDGSWDALKELIIKGSEMAGVDPALMATMANIESSFRITAQPRNRAGQLLSSAKGLYQFLDSTWREMLNKYGSKYGISTSAHQFDPRANVLMGAEFLKENEAHLRRRLSRNITDTDLYAAHFLGAGGATTLLGQNPNTNAVTLMPGPANSNRSIFYENGRPRTVRGVYEELDRRVNNRRITIDQETINSLNDLKTSGEMSSNDGSSSINIPEGYTGGSVRDNVPQMDIADSSAIRNANASVDERRQIVEQAANASVVQNRLISEQSDKTFNEMLSALHKQVALQQSMDNTLKHINKTLIDIKEESTNVGKTDNQGSEENFVRGFRPVEIGSATAPINFQKPN